VSAPGDPGVRERLEGWAADPRTRARLRRAIWVLLVAAVVGLLSKGGNRPADPSLEPVPAVSTSTVPSGG
jgi:hypothetical protein